MSVLLSALRGTHALRSGRVRLRSAWFGRRGEGEPAGVARPQPNASWAPFLAIWAS